ncbi:MAG: ribonuclease [Planctomycetota bacterium]|nr:MAG: ribonuclease [Planctomycetota bacterium]
MALPPTGAVVQIRRGAEVLLACVTGRKGEQLLVLLADDGRIYKVPPERVLQVAGTLARPADREAALAELRALREQALACAAEVDLALLWEQMRDDPEGQSIARLCEIYHGTSGSPVEWLGFGFALCADRIYFRQQGQRFVPRMQSEVQQRLEQQQAERRARERRQLFVRWAAAALAAHQAGEPPPARPEEVDLAPEIELLIEWALRPEEGGQTARRARALLEEVAAAAPSGVRLAANAEGAFVLLVALGQFEPHENLALRRLGVPTEFAPELEERAARVVPYTWEGSAPGAGAAARRDLRALPAFTIDGAETTDRDDALSLEPLGPGRWRVGIHIADAAWFVPASDPLDREALRRATSLYLPDRRIPMLPPALGERRMSLDAGQDRPALSFLVEVDETGALGQLEVVRSAVRVERNLTYAEATRAILAGEEPLASLHRLAEALAARRLEAGAVLVPGRDRRIVVEPGGRVRVLVTDERSPANRLVAEMMILANRLAARELAARGVAAIYRCQQYGGAGDDAPLRPEQFPSPEVYAYEVRRRLGRTELRTEPAPHATLGVEAYVQITSPIRRYQDLVLQRQLAAAIAGEPPPYDRQQIVELMGASEAALGEALQVVRESEQYWLLQYLRQSEQRLYEAEVVAHTRDGKALLVIPELDLRHALRVPEPLAPGTRVILELLAAHPRRGEVSFRLQKVVSIPQRSGVGSPPPDAAEPGPAAGAPRDEQLVPHHGGEGIGR